MKNRLLTLVVLMLTVVGIQAQTLQFTPNRVLNRSFQHAPRKAASLEGTTAWGLGGDSQWSSLGLGSGVVNVKFSVAIFVPGNELLKGAKIQGVNIPVVDEGMTDVSIWVKSELNGSDLARATVTGSFVGGEYFAAALNEPVTIPEGGVYVGYDFINAADYCIAISYDGAAVDGGLFLNYVYNGSSSGWGDYSSQFPPSMLQVLVSGFSLPDYSIVMKSAQGSTQKASDPYTIAVDFMSNSANAITDFDVEVAINGNTEQKHIALDAPLSTGVNVPGSFVVEGTSPASTGAFNADVTVKKINGVAVDISQISAVLKNVTRVVARRTVIEEFTGTGCGWCPRGWVGMEYMKENYPESFIGIAFHKYNSSDPMYYANYPYLGLTGAPGCVVDRKIDCDPFYGNTDYEYGIAIEFKNLNKDIPSVDISCKANWNEDQSSVLIDANVEFLVAPDNNVSLVYVLTADSLSGTTDSWKQSNYYASYQASQLGSLGMFGAGGSRGTSSVSLVFNDVVIGSSYDANGINQGNHLKRTVVSVGGSYGGQYTIALPTKAALKNALKKNLLTGVVLVVDDNTGFILNAAKAHVEDTADAVRGVENTVVGQEVRYNMAGQQITTPQRGVNIMRTADGRIRKVLVR
ncbi:MAG: hypothetical protein J6Y04_08560 [Bacteroidaceae bacterium]|nr:hypothetical protein [Bacteroidaceae bacterium]